MARKQKGGKRRARVRYPLGGKHHQLACVRKTLLHHSSRHITGNATAVVLEDLKVQKMIASAAGTVENPGRNVAQKSGLNRGNLAQGWGLLKQMLDNKARQRVAVNPACTSQTRPACGGAEQRSRVSARDHHCVACGRIHVDSIQPSTLCGTPWASGWSHSVEQLASGTGQLHGERRFTPVAPQTRDTVEPVLRRHDADASVPKVVSTPARVTWQDRRAALSWILGSPQQRPPGPAP